MLVIPLYRMPDAVTPNKKLTCLLSIEQWNVHIVPPTGCPDPMIFVPLGIYQ